LKKVGVQTHESNLKVIGGFEGEFEKTSVNNIYAVGDCLDKVPELTPIAQQSANLLAHRIFLKTVHFSSHSDFSNSFLYRKEKKILQNINIK